MSEVLLWEKERLVGALADAAARKAFACPGACEVVLHSFQRRLRVLVVDDMAVHRQIIKAAFVKSCGSPLVTTADSGEEACRHLAAEGTTFDLVVCDWAMPEMDGLDVLRWMRGQAALAAVPFIMVSARDEEEEILTALRAGAQGFLVKPVVGMELCQLSAAVLSVRPGKELP